MKYRNLKDTVIKLDEELKIQESKFGRCVKDVSFYIYPDVLLGVNNLSELIEAAKEEIILTSLPPSLLKRLESSLYEAYLKGIVIKMYFSLADFENYPKYFEEITNILRRIRIEIIQTDAGDTLYAVNNILKLWKSDEGYIPVLTLLLNKQVDLKKIVVDKGAIRFVANGADIMRPGITKIDSSIKRGDIVVIVDENHDRALAIGKSMLDAKQMEEKKSGKVVQNLHTIQDNVWEFEKEFR